MSFFSNTIRVDRRLQKEISLARGIRGLDLRVRGTENTVIIRSTKFKGTVSVCGKGNTLIIEEDVTVDAPCTIRLGVPGAPCFGGTVHIGRNTFLGGVDLRTAEDDSVLEIGADCMMAHGVKIWGTDGHICRAADGRLNVGRRVSIGRHVWVGEDCKIGKNTEIPDGCIIGWGSVVRGRFTEPNSVIAGNPAQQCHSGISWDSAMVATEMENARIHREPNWDAASRAPLFLRPLLRLQLAWYNYQAKHKKRSDKREKYERKAARVKARL